MVLYYQQLLVDFFNLFLVVARVGNVGVVLSDDVKKSEATGRVGGVSGSRGARGGLLGYHFKLLGDTTARFLSQPFILVGTSDSVERRRRGEALGRARVGLARDACRGSD